MLDSHTLRGFCYGNETVMGQKVFKEFRIVKEFLHNELKGLQGGVESMIWVRKHRALKR